MGGRALVFLVYVLSGACGLVYEVVWTRMLSLTFGVTVFATSAVLAAYMAGLGLGSWLVGRRIDRSANPVRVYALLELGIGVYALAVPAIFTLLRPAYVAIANALEDHFLLFNVVRGALAFAVLLVPTTLMGGTVPAIGRYLVTRRESLGWNVGLLYALNTIGAVAGCLAAGFVMIGALGMWRTTLVTAGVNIGIGLGLLALQIGAEARAGRDPAPAARAVVPPTVRLATFVFAASGFSALAYEVVWTRVLVIHVHNSTYAFSAMLAVFLFGLAAGDALLMRYYDRIARPLVWLGTVEVLIGVSVMVAARLYIGLRDVGTAATGGFAYAATVMFMRAALVLLPGALLFGMTFPLVARIVTLGMGSVGRDVAGAYAANTLGGVLGSLAGGFLLVPLLGLRGTLVALAATNVCLGAACWLFERRGRALAPVAAMGVLAALPFVVIPKKIFFYALETINVRLIYYSEDVTDTTGVWESMTDGSRVVTYGDMRGTAGTVTDPINRVQGHMAHLLHPRPTRSLQICFGVGNTLAASALHPEVERLDCVELSPQVRQTAPYFWTNANVLDDPKVRLIVDDGRNYLLRTRERYDVITLEPPDVYTAGVVNLFTKEFYQLAYDALADDGLLCAWLPVAEMNETEMRMMVAAFQAVFPQTSLWREGYLPAAPLMLIGTKRPLAIDVDELGRRLAASPVRADAERLGFGTPERFLGLFIAGPEGTRRWVAGAPPITDDRTVVDYTTPREVYSGYGFGFLRVRGEEAAESRRHLREIEGMYRRIAEPITPHLRDRAIATDEPARAGG